MKLLLPLILLSVVPAKAVLFVGGSPAGTAPLSEGVAVGDDGRGYVFITPRHFVYTHIGASSFGGAAYTVANVTDISTPGSNQLHLAELSADLPGITPLPILTFGTLSDLTNLALRVFGSTGANYGTAVTSPTTSFTITNNTASGNPVYLVDLLDAVAGAYPSDLSLIVDYRFQNTVPGTGIVVSGDSNGGLVGNVGGNLYALGAALGVIDVESPTGGGLNTDAGVFPFLGVHQADITAYLAARSLALGSAYQASFVNPFGAVVPEPSRAITTSLALAAVALRRRRPCRSFLS